MDNLKAQEDGGGEVEGPGRFISTFVYHVYNIRSDLGPQQPYSVRATEEAMHQYEMISPFAMNSCCNMLDRLLSDSIASKIPRPVMQ